MRPPPKPAWLSEPGDRRARPCAGVAARLTGDAERLAGRVLAILRFDYCSQPRCTSALHRSMPRCPSISSTPAPPISTSSAYEPTMTSSPAIPYMVAPASSNSSLVLSTFGFTGAPHEGFSHGGIDYVCVLEVDSPERRRRDSSVGPCVANNSTVEIKVNVSWKLRKPLTITLGVRPLVRTFAASDAVICWRSTNEFDPVVAAIHTYIQRPTWTLGHQALCLIRSQERDGSASGVDLELVETVPAADELPIAEQLLCPIVEGPRMRVRVEEPQMEEVGAWASDEGSVRREVSEV